MKHTKVTFSLCHFLTARESNPFLDISDIHLLLLVAVCESCSTGSSFPADSAKSVPLTVVSKFASMGVVLAFESSSQLCFLHSPLCTALMVPTLFFKSISLRQNVKCQY
jgi:hypothetical protein